MTYFLKSGTSYRVSSREEMNLHEELPAGNYTVQQDMNGNFYLSQIDDFDLPSKLYGNTTRHSSRIINTFTKRSSSTGVLLNGEKGSGKTLLAKNISIEMAKEGVPTILINNAFTGDSFYNLLQSIEQPCIVLMDEFDKTFDKEQQEKILTMFDGVFSSKKLFLLTANDKYRIDAHMRNRPGRLHYLIDFSGVDAEFVAEYCRDKGVDEKYIDNICSISSLFSEFNFDMLRSLVAEMQMYGESPAQALEFLNIKPEFDRGSEYKVTLIDEGKEILETQGLWPTNYRGNPLNQAGINVQYDASDSSKDNEDDEEEYRNFVFTSNDLLKVDATKGLFVFENNINNTRLVLTKIKNEYKFDYSAL